MMKNLFSGLALLNSEAQAAITLALGILSAMLIYLLCHYPLSGSNLEDTTDKSVTSHRYSYIINVNTAEAWEIALVPGIGPKKAAAIIDYRIGSGDFQTFKELEKVKGIGPHAVEWLQNYCALK